MTVGLLALGRTITGNYVAEGDSISSTDRTVSQGYPPYCQAYATSRSSTTFTDMAQSGNGLIHLVSRNPSSNIVGGKKNLFSVLIGHNDIVAAYPTTDGGTRANFIAALASYLDLQKTNGFTKVIVGTIQPSTAVATGGFDFNTERNAINTVIKTWVGVHCDAVADFGGDATMGPDAAASNTALYTDGIHPSSAGQVIMQNILGPILDGYF